MTDTVLPTPENPLAKYFRLPGLQVDIPSRGAFFSPGQVQLDDDGTLAIYPMRAADEYLLKTPDALLSGHAIEKLIESCVPGIKRPREVSTPDLDVLLLAIRVASYGDKMDVEAVCPKCKQENTFAADLPGMLSTMTYIDADPTVRLDDQVIVYLRPYNFHNTTQVSMTTFNETRKVQAVEADEEATDKMKRDQLNASMDVITRLNTDLTADCVMKVVTPEGTVTAKPFIRDFMSNIPKKWTVAIEKKLEEMNQAGIDKTVHPKCANKACNHEWDTKIEFDPSNFFD